jgi:hypothetical protein
MAVDKTYWKRKLSLLSIKPIQLYSSPEIYQWGAYSAKWSHISDEIAYLLRAWSPKAGRCGSAVKGT